MSGVLTLQRIQQALPKGTDQPRHPAKERSEMKKARFLFLMATTLFFLSSLVPPACAETESRDPLKWVPGTVFKGGRIGFGPLRLLLAVGLQWDYNDNIFWSSGEIGDPLEDDTLYHALPTAFLDQTFEDGGGWRIGYQGDFVTYRDFDTNDWERNQARFDLDYLRPGGLIARVNNVYTLTDDPFGDVAQYKLGIPTEREFNDLRARIGYDFGQRFRLLFLGDYYKQVYDDAADFTQDWDRYAAGVGIEFPVATRTWFFLRYHYGVQEFTSEIPPVTAANNADNTYHQGDIGLQLDPGGRLRGELNVGYQMRTYENDFDSDGDPYADKDTWVAETAIHYLPDNKKVPEYELADYAMLSLNIWRNVHAVGAGTTDFFTETGIGGNVRYDVTPRFNLRWYGKLSTKDYRNASNEQVGWGAWGVNFTWRIWSWIGIDAGYAWEKQNSTINANDFEISRFLLTVTGAI
jgi:hypothetical protein